MNSLTRKLSITLIALFLIIAVALAYITRQASIQYNHEITQRLNGSIAMYVAEEEQLIENGQHNEAAIKRLAERAMIINPTVEVYLLDNEGQILSHNLPPEAVQQSQVPLDTIHQFLAPESHRPLLSLDPRSPETTKAFSAAKVTHNGVDQGYVYAILGGHTYEQLAQDISKNFVMKVALAAIIAVMLLGWLIAHLMFKKLTKPLTALTSQVRQFQKKITGDDGDAYTEGDEITVLESSFNHMAKQIRAQLEQIKAADQNRRDLITNISHDLRTPLASIQGYLDTLNIKQQQLDDEQKIYYLETASKHCVRLNSLVNDLFELSKLDSLAVKPSIEIFSMSELMQDVSLEFKHLASKKNIDLQIDLLSGNTDVKADIGLMQRVLENLIENAIKHTPANGKVILKLAQQDDQFEVIVRDTGRGISKKELPFIFDRLYRAENSSRYSQSSSGLGLAIVKKILDLHKSQIKVISKLERGTQFAFQLPVAA